MSLIDDTNSRQNSRFNLTAQREFQRILNNLVDEIKNDSELGYESKFVDLYTRVEEDIIRSCVTHNLIMWFRAEGFKVEQRYFRGTYFEQIYIYWGKHLKASKKPKPWWKRLFRLG